MIAVDTSSFVAFLAGEEGRDVDLVGQAIEGELLIIPPVVVAELLSASNLNEAVKATILALPQMELISGYWQRVGEVRAKILSGKRKANLADTMIAVFCLDHDVSLITRDRDYRHFAELFGLKLVA